jgi:hypothetical protein
VLKGSRLLTALPTAKALATEASRGSAKAPTRGGQVLESLVAHRLIDLDSEWHLDRHRYEHLVWEIYLAKRRAGIRQHLISQCGLSLRP